MGRMGLASPLTWAGSGLKHHPPGEQAGGASASPLTSVGSGLERVAAQYCGYFGASLPSFVGSGLKLPALTVGPLADRASPPS